MATRVHAPLTGLPRVRFFRDPPRNCCNFLKAVHSTCENEKKEKKEIRQAGILVAVDSTDHYTNEDVVLSSPSPPNVKTRLVQGIEPEPAVL